MNKKLLTIKTLLVVGIIGTFFSCASLFTKGGLSYENARSSYKRQDYIAAVKHCLEALEKNPEYEDAQNLLQTVYTEGTAVYQEKGEAGKNADNVIRQKEAYEAYQYLQELHTVAANSGRNDLEVQDWTADIERSYAEMLEGYYTLANRYLNEGTVKQARMAVDFFKELQTYEKEYKDSVALLQKAIDQGTIVIGIDVGMPDRAGTKEKYDDFVFQFKDNEYIQVAPLENYPGSSMVGPFDQMYNDVRRGKLDMAIQLYTNVKIDTGNDNSKGMVTIDNPRADSGYSFNVYYNVNAELNYQISTAENINAYSDTIKYSESQNLQVNKIMGVLHEDVKLDDTGKHNLIVSNLNNGLTQEDISQLVYDVTRTFKSFPIPAELQGVTDHRVWRQYFYDNYDFSDLQRKFNNSYFSDAVAFYAPDTKYYYYIWGMDITESLQTVEVVKAMYQGIAGAALDLVKEAPQAEGQYIFNMMTQVGEYINANY